MSSPHITSPPASLSENLNFSKHLNEPLEHPSQKSDVETGSKPMGDDISVAEPSHLHLPDPWAACRVDTPALGSPAATGHTPMWGSSPASLSGTPPQEPHPAGTPSPLSTPSSLSHYLLCPPPADPPAPSASSHLPVFAPQRGAPQTTALMVPFPYPCSVPTTGHIPAARGSAS